MTRDISLEHDEDKPSDTGLPYMSHLEAGTCASPTIIVRENDSYGKGGECTYPGKHEEMLSCRSDHEIVSVSCFLRATGA